MNDNEYVHMAVQASRLARSRSRTRMERLRRTALRWKILAALFAVLFLALLTAPDAVSAAEEEPAPAVTTAPAERVSGTITEVAPLLAAKDEPEREEAAPTDGLPRIENVTVTHYCICKKCCGKDEDHPAYGITASGRKAEPAVSVAVDPALIPLGSTVYVDYGDGELHTYRADDTGSGVAGAHLDVCMASHEAALQAGVKTAIVWWEADR